MLRWLLILLPTLETIAIGLKTITSNSTAWEPSVLLSPGSYDPLAPECFNILSRSPPLTLNQCDGLISYFTEEERRHELLEYDPSHGPYTYRPTSEEGGGPCHVMIYPQQRAEDGHYTYHDLAGFLYKVMHKCRGGYGRDSRGGRIRMAFAGHERAWPGFWMRVDAFHSPRPDRRSLQAANQEPPVIETVLASQSMSVSGSPTTRFLPAPKCFEETPPTFPELRAHQCDRLLAYMLSSENRHLHILLDDSKPVYSFNVDPVTTVRHCTITIKPVIRGAQDDFTYYDVAKFAMAIYEGCEHRLRSPSRGGEIPMRFVGPGPRPPAGFQLRLSGELPPR